MGLGPPVCKPCFVVMHLEDRTWRCPICRSEKSTCNLLDLSLSAQKRLQWQQVNEQPK